MTDFIDYGKGYKEQGRIGDRYVLISWDNGQNKFTDYRIDLYNNDWKITGGNHNNRLADWVFDKANDTD